MRSQQLRAIFFDLDGTLLDNSEVVIEAYYSGMQRLGYKPKDREYIRSLLGKSTFDIGKDLGLKDKDLSAIDTFFWDFFGNSANDPNYIPNVYSGVRELLNFLKEHNIPTAIVTSNKAEFAKILIKKVNLDNYITVYIGSEDVIKKKPSAEPLQVALKKINISKIGSKDNSIWFIGDTPSDVLSAINAGLISVAVPEKGKLNLLRQSEPDFIFDSMKDCYKHILKLFC